MRVVIEVGQGDELETRVRERVDDLERVEELRDADAVVTNRLTAERLRGATRLRLVQGMSAGVDLIDRDALPPGCVLCNAYEHEDAIGEWALMGLLALTHHLLPYDRRLRDGDWGRDLPMERELRGRTLGCIGYGHIGRRTAELARAFGMETIAVTRTPSPERAAGLVRLDGMEGLDALLADADAVLVAVPLADETRALIGARELDLLGPDGYVLNVARGEIVDERSLYEALHDRRIAGAAIDVWYRYPGSRDERTHPSELPFHELDNVVMTPHVSGRSEGTRDGRLAFAVEQLVRLAEGRPLENVVAVG